MSLLQIKEQALKDIIETLEPIFEKVGVNFYYLIGAKAKEIWYNKANKISSNTKDIDFAVLVANIEQFTQVKDILQNEHNFSTVKGNEFSLVSQSGTIIDLLPFGKNIEINDGVIVEGMGLHNIKVNGFQEIANTSVKEVAEQSNFFHIATLPAIIILKLIAFDERPEQRTKDAEDIANIIDCFFDIETNIFYDDHYDVLERIDEGNDVIAARVIGRLLQDPLKENANLKTRVTGILTKQIKEAESSRFVSLMATETGKSIEDYKKMLSEMLQGIYDKKMPEQSNLFFNILTFDFPKQNFIFHFSKEEIGKAQKLHWSLFPNEIETIFPGIKGDGTQFIYTTFTGEVEGYIPLSINLSTENKDLVKRYYDRQVNFYFRSLQKQIVKVGYIKENQIWLPKPELNTKSYNVYEKYSIKIQIAQISNFPEIYLSYDGITKVLNRSVEALVKTGSPSLFNRVMHQNQLYKFKELEENNIADFAQVFPVLNINLARELKFDFTKPKRPNKYIHYLESITKFVDTFFNTTQFQQLLPLHSTNFSKVNISNINRTNQDGNQLLFGNKQFNSNPYMGMFNGPYQRAAYTNIHFFFVMHKKDVKHSLTLYKYFTDGLGNFVSFNRYTNSLFYTETGFSIIFNDNENPVNEIETALEQRIFNPDVKYFAIYLTPFSKETANKNQKEVYYKVKEQLLKRDIPTQVIDPVKMHKAGLNFAYSLPNIYIAIIAKLKGIPWRLPKQIQDELIVGVGAFKNEDLETQFIGSAFSFNNNGTFNKFEYFMKHQVDILAGSIANQIRQFTASNNKLNRLIIHFYKAMSDDELEPILKQLNNLGLNIPVFIVSIGKTESKDLIAFDSSLTGLMPQSGTYINLGNGKFLLFNNTRYTQAVIKATEAWQFPIKLQIESTQPELLKEGNTVANLIQQVYEFSKLYWKSVSHQNLPVTIKYPEMVARIAPHFDGEDIPHFGKDNLWFL
jgi:predicted nucleotidyltransferase